MSNGPALVIEPFEVPLLFERMDEFSPRPEVDKLMFGLSHRGALRVGEIANLTPDAVLDPRGRLRDEIRITITKGHRARTIYMHPEIRALLEAFFGAHPYAQWFAISPRDGGQMKPAALGMHFKRIYEALGFIGCTSHTGRASCITELAQRAGEFGCSLEDVKRFAGHKHLSSTEKYLRPTERGRDLVHALGRNSDRLHFHQHKRSNHGSKSIRRNHRYQDPATIVQRQQHEVWVAQQFIRSRVQP